jgi:hypothetical protein
LRRGAIAFEKDIVGARVKFDSFAVELIGSDLAVNNDPNVNLITAIRLSDDDYSRNGTFELRQPT